MRSRRILESVLALSVLGSAELIGRVAFAQSNVSADNPQEAISTFERFLALNKASQLDSPAGRALLSGELARHREPSLGRFDGKFDKFVMLSDGQAVARIPAPVRQLPDIYFFLRQQPDGHWTVEAGRVLAIPAFVTILRSQIRDKAARSEEEQNTLRNLDLLMSTDRDLRNWFKENQKELERLVSLAKDPNQPVVRAGDGKRIETPEVQASLARLGASMLIVESSSAIEVLIGGILDNQVGFLFAPGDVPVPPIDSTEYIWIEPVGAGWYLFKTT